MIEKNKMKKLLFSLMVCGAALPAAAHTDLLNQDFNGVYDVDFTFLELDNLSPASSINAIFMGSDGVSKPWWHAKDDKQTKDRYMVSHSYYKSPGTSNDWLVSRPITIPSEGFKLTFGAQSLPVRAGDEHALSDLRVYITEKPVTKDWQPTEPTLLVENLPYGEDRDKCEGDFLPYEINLDQFVGKTVYVSFANLNTDKDLLAIDNVLVRRLDNAEISVTAPERILSGQEFPVNIIIKGTFGDGLKNWTLDFACADNTKQWTGESLALNQQMEFSTVATVPVGVSNIYTVTLKSENNAPIIATGEIAGLQFQTTKRIVAEETTGTWCGNCPKAIYTLEQLEMNEEYEGLILPVSIHVGNDPMGNENYEYMFGLGAVAPFVRVDRHDELIGFALVDDNPDPKDPQTAAYSIVAHLNEIALCDVNVTASYLKNAGKISGIDATAELIPAVDMEGKDYQIGFILTENNVTAPKAHNSWNQQNYEKGQTIAQNCGNPWGSLPKSVSNMRYQDVARQIYDFRGLENSLPDRTLKAGEKVTFNTQLGLPQLGGEYQGTLNPENLYLTVFVIEKGKDICKMLNANRIALGDNPEPKFTSLDVAKELGLDPAGVEGVETEFNGEAEYYNLQGIRVLEPAAGIYIVRRGDKVTKEVVR